MKRIIFFLLITASVSFTVQAKKTGRIIRGTVTEAGSLVPLENVQVLAKTSKMESGSQTDGIFTIPVADNDSLLLFILDAYETREVKLGPDNEVSVQLKKAEKTSVLTPELVSGNWRGVFTLRPGVEVPFHFTIGVNGDLLNTVLVNGDEKFPAGALRITGDSLFIPLPLFDNELALRFENNVLTGVLRRQDLRGNPTQLRAQKGLDYRFEETGSSPLKDISGNYDVVFLGNGGKEEKAVGIFRQKGSKVYATFLRVTGDSRYLEGTIEDNVIRLSAFIGSSPALYVAQVTADGIIKGENLNARGAVPFTATPNAAADLPDAYTLTRLKEGSDRLTFNFTDAEGKTVSSTDTKFAGKPLIISIGGTWCPNCMDEAAFLGPWYKQNKQRGIEVIALQYERQTDAPYVKKVFDRFRKQYNLEYTLLLGGIADKQAVVTSLPALENFLSFPTTLFVDKTGKVQKIHTGFTGPATGKHYTAFIQEFNEEVDKLLK